MSCICVHKIFIWMGSFLSHLLYTIYNVYLYRYRRISINLSLSLLDTILNYQWDRPNKVRFSFGSPSQNSDGSLRVLLFSPSLFFLLILRWKRLLSVGPRLVGTHVSGPPTSWPSKLCRFSSYNTLSYTFRLSAIFFYNVFVRPWLSVETVLQWKND